MASSFELFPGFWPAFEIAPRLGCRLLTGGGQSSLQRLELIFRHRVSVLLCTPSYALHRGEVAARNGIEVATSSVRITIHAGEPGANIPSVKSRIEKIWRARCFDHIGASEIGPYAFECHCQPGGSHINELYYIPECIDPLTLEPVAPGQVGELVLTNLNRSAFPVIRYRTGDLVRFCDGSRCLCGRSFRVIQGGILSRLSGLLLSFDGEINRLAGGALFSGTLPAAIFLEVQIAGGYSTQVEIVNPNQVSTNLVFDLFDEGGELIATSSRVLLAQGRLRVSVAPDPDNPAQVALFGGSPPLDNLSLIAADPNPIEVCEGNLGMLRGRPRRWGSGLAQLTGTSFSKVARRVG